MSSNDGGNLAEFAKAHGLEPGTDGALPDTGSIFGAGHKGLKGACHGTLPGGANGSLVHVRWETKTDDSTTIHLKTAVVIRVPESLGYAPYLQIGHEFPISVAMTKTKTFDSAPGVEIRANAGVDQKWLTELFSPAFAEWLQRSPEDFGAELADGVLVVIRNGHLTNDSDLVNLCSDAHRIAEEIRSEALEEVESGGGSVAKGEAPDRKKRVALGLVPDLIASGPRANVESALGEARSSAARSGAVIAGTIKSTIVIMLAVNIVGGGVYGLLLNLGNPLQAVLIYQVILLVIIAPLRFRSFTKNIAATASEETFFQAYEHARQLKEVDPLQFSAEHAEANLPGKPVRVMEGLFGGTAGCLMLTGNGRERGHQIALVRGPKGPIATTELNVSAPGISAKALDAYVDTLVLDLQTQPSAPAAPSPPAQ